jgi:hypothetical protein
MILACPGFVAVLLLLLLLVLLRRYCTTAAAAGPTISSCLPCTDR